MSDAVLISIITGVFAIIGIVVKTALNKVQKQVDKIHIQINSRMDELLKLTRESYEAKGVLKEKEDQANKSSL